MIIKDTIYVGVIVLLVVFFVFFAADETPDKVVVAFGQGKKIDISYSQQEIGYEEMLSEIYSNEFAKSGLMDWLAERDIFSFDDPSLAFALNTKLCEEIPSENLSERIEKSKKCADLKISKELRRLADKKQVPFHYIGKSIQIGVPRKGHQPSSGEANTCKKGEFDDTRVELVHPSHSERYIIVNAYGGYECGGGFGKFPHIQLSAEDATKLFPGPLDKYQEAIAVILSNPPPSGT